MSDKAMAELSYFVCVPLLLFCLFHASDNRHVRRDIFSKTGSPEVDDVFSNIPIPSPNATDPENTFSLQLCTDIKEELETLKTLLLETTQDNSRLNEEVFGLNREVKKLSLNLNTCTLALSSVAGSYQNQLQIQMNNLLDTVDSEIFHVLKIMTLTRELNILEKKIKLAVESNGNSTLISILQKEQEEKTNELNAKKLRIDRDPATLTLILQTISLQDQIWDLIQEEFTSETAAQLTKKILDLQKHLDRNINELKEKGDPLLDLLELISVQSKITVLEMRINFQTEESKAKIDDARRQLKEKTEQLKNVIVLLSKQKGNKTLTRKILQLQMEVEQLEDLISNLENVEATLIVIRADLVVQKKQEDLLQKKLEEADSVVAQLILKIISIMQELRKQQQTSPGQQQDILTLFSTCKREYTAAQNEIKRLRQTCEESPVLKEKYKELKKNFDIKVEENQSYQATIEDLRKSVNQTERKCPESEQKIKDLQNSLDSRIHELKSQTNNVTSLTVLKPVSSVLSESNCFFKVSSFKGLSETALQITTLTANLGELNRQLANSVSKSKVDELQQIIDEKNKELDTKTKKLKEISPQAQRFLQIVAKLTEIERLSNLPANETNYAKITVLQDQIKTLIDGIKDKDDENTKLMFQILAYQDEIAKLQKHKEEQLEAQAKRVTELENELENIKIQIEEKTNQVNIPGIRIANLSAEILELQNKIQPLEEELSDLKETYETNLAELQERLNAAKTQLQDDELLLKQSDAKIFDLIMEINDLKTQLKNAKKQASKANTHSIADLEEKLKTQQRESKKLESTNKNLKQEVEALRTRCPVDADCEDLQRQLQQSQKDADYYHKLVQEKENALKNLRRDFDAQAQEKARLQQDYDDLLKKQLEVENQTIQTSIQTMDPNTAHPRIILSPDRTEITTSDSALQVQDNPSRFDVSLAVLGSTGYSRGRHYWEVSVAGKSCYHIGMASESAPRKGSLSFNPTRGFWTIILNKQGQLRALNKRPAAIQAATQPLTLGVLLDYKKGQISFYDAGTRSHLYTFSGQTFTDKIYPFINYCIEDGANPIPVVVVQPGSTDWIK